MIPMEQLEAIVQAAEKKSVCVFVDEAYGDYMLRTASAITLVNKYSNLIVTRSFSKAFGLAGLRLGYLVAQPYVIRHMKKLTTPYDGYIPNLFKRMTHYTMYSRGLFCVGRTAQP